jgi:hypothetical protein
MSNFFPRQTVAWKLEEPPAFRRLALNVVEMGAITGVVLRLARAVAYTHGGQGVLFLIVTVAIALVFMFGMATLHLGNFTLRHWVWRAPAFAAAEVVAEAVTSALLIALHREPWGTARASIHDWVGMARIIFVTRFALIVLYAWLLAGIVQFVRWALLKHDHRTSMAEAVRRTAEHEA